MEKRLIPYSVHLPEPIYNKLKAAAGQRKASALVRDAITLIVEGDDEFNGGYNKGVRDCISLVRQDDLASTIRVGDKLVADQLVAELEDLIVPQNIVKNGRKKEK